MPSARHHHHDTHLTSPHTAMHAGRSLLPRALADHCQSSLHQLRHAAYTSGLLLLPTGQKRHSSASALSSAAAPTHPLSHITTEDRPGMVDVSGKAVTRRIAVARSLLHLPPAVSALFLASEPSTSPPSSPSSPRSPPSPSPDLHLAKGPVFATAIIAGTMAVKQTSSLIPLCHPLPLEHIALRIRHHPPAAVQQQLQPPAAGGVPEGWGVLSIDCEVRCSGKTGVEMEALVGASVAALTCYDMLKAVSHAMVLSDTRLLSKEGGKSKLVHAPDTQQQQQQQQRGGAGVGTV